MDNIPNGYDENGERLGSGRWVEVCPECGSKDIVITEDGLYCNECEYEEGPDDDIKEFRARHFDKSENTWSEWKDIIIEE